MGRRLVLTAIAILAIAAVAAVLYPGYIEPILRDSDRDALRVGQIVTIPDDPLGMEFEFLGCPGDWPDNLPIEPIITKTTNGGTASFLVRDPVDCGMSLKEPSYKLEGDSIALTYTVYASGDVAACFCEYKSRFSFQRLPGNVRSAMIRHE